MKCRQVDWSLQCFYCHVCERLTQGNSVSYKQPSRVLSYPRLLIVQQSAAEPCAGGAMFRRYFQSLCSSSYERWLFEASPRLLRASSRLLPCVPCPSPRPFPGGTSRSRPGGHGGQAPVPLTSPTRPCSLPITFIIIGSNLPVSLLTPGILHSIPVDYVCQIHPQLN